MWAWRDVQEKAVDLWRGLPTPVRWVLSGFIVVWRVLGWIDDHLGRITVLLIIAGGIVAGMTFVVGYYLSNVEPFWILLGVLLAIALVLSSANSIMGMMRIPSGTPALPAAAGDSKVEDETTKYALLRIVAIAINGEAALRIENEGPEVAIAARLERIEGLENQTLPYRMPWKLDPDERFPIKKERTQKTLEIGTIGVVQVTESLGEDTVQFKLPGGLFLPVPRPKSGQLLIGVQFLCEPPLRTGAHHTCMLEFAKGDTEVLEFKEKVDAGARIEE